MTVRRAAIGDEETLRVLRLQAMIDAPQQFGSTYERELARTTEDWRRWLAPGATYIFEDAAGPRGLVAGVWADAEPRVVYLMAVWVHPSARGMGAGDALVEAVLTWSAQAGAKVVRVHVVDGNNPALGLYERQGFVRTGAMISRERDGVIEIEMERQVP